ncbi:MAG: cytochrome P450 [Acidimicrobiia bacterium]|nr:cytochrome P450 [Acidimicrobiia bacterium]
MGGEQLGGRLDHAMSQPYPMWARARAECPVLRYDDSGFDGRPSFHVTRFADAERVLRDWEAFSSSINGEVIGRYMGELILALDGPEHRHYRDLVAHAFRASSIERWERELMVPIVDGLLDRIAPLGRADLVRDVTSRYPVQVIAGIVGVPLDDHDRFMAWAEDVNSGPLDPERGLAASRAMRDYLEPIVEARRREPRGDLVSELVTAEIEGERLTDERIYGFLRLLLPAGAETTFRVMGSCLVALLTHPQVLARAAADPDVLHRVIEETLRWETSVTMVSRIATRDVEVAGCPIPAGSPVTVLTGSADHDEARFPEPEEWSLDRPPRQHLAFGTGPHQCLGMHLARLELRVGLAAVLGRLPNLRPDPDAPPPTVEGFFFRGPSSLPVLFDPA